MNQGLTGRVISGAVVAGLLGFVIYQSQVANASAGREAYLAAQAARFDLTYAHLNPVSIISFALLFAGILALYEALAFGITKVIARRAPSEPPRA